MRALRRKEGLEDLLSHVVGHSHTVVAELKLQSLVFAAAGDRQLPASRHRVNRIDDHVHKNFPQLRRAAVRRLSIAGDELNVVLQPANPRLVLPARARDFNRVIQQNANVNQLKLLHGRLARERLNTSHCGRGVFSRCLNNVEITNQRGFIDLPARTTQLFQLAINGPQALLRAHGWNTVDAMRVSRTLLEYRDFIHRSKAEFAVAKHTYVASHSGWFSDRTECYLASGRPALVQDTGWTAHLPHGDGLLAFTTPDEALAGLDRINSDFDHHARASTEVAREHFDAGRVLARLLETASS